VKRPARLGFGAAAVAGAAALAVWLLKDRFTGAVPATDRPDETPRFRPAPTRPPAPHPAPGPPEDLSEIAGIGPVYKERLADAGVTTFAALAQADAAEMAKKIEAPVSRVQAWIDAARRR